MYHDCTLQVSGDVKGPINDSQMALQAYQEEWDAAEQRRRQAQEEALHAQMMADYGETKPPFFSISKLQILCPSVLLISNSLFFHVLNFKFCLCLHSNMNTMIVFENNLL